MHKTLLLFILFINQQLLFAQNKDSIDTEFDFEKINQINIFFDSLNRKHKSNLLNDEITRIYKTNRFNGVVLISQNNKTIYHKAFGYANYRTRAKLSTQSIFELASVSKQFTAIAILKLYEEGKLCLNDTIQKYIPCFPYKKRTIHHLLCHRGGLPDYFAFSPGAWKNKDSLMKKKDLISIICKNKYRAKHWVDTKHDYSNTGYVVLAYIVEIVSGKSFADYLNETFFLPLNMKNTFAGKIPNNLLQNKTNGHTSGRGLRSVSFMDGCVGDKGVWSTAYDLNLWSNALFGGKVIPDSLLNLATTPQNHDLPIDSNYGYGFRLGAIYEDKNLVHHGGLWGGYNTLFIRRIHDKINVIVLSNVDNKSFRHQSNRWIEIVEQL